MTNDFKNATLAARSRPTSRHDLECRPDGWDDGKKGDLERAVEYIRNERPKGKKDKVPNLPGESGQTAACVGHTKIKWLNDVSIPARIPFCVKEIGANRRIEQGRVRAAFVG